MLGWRGAVAVASVAVLFAGSAPGVLRGGVVTTARAGAVGPSYKSVGAFVSQRNALIASLRSAPGGAALAGTEQTVTSVQGSLVADQETLASLNQQLASVASQIQSNSAYLATDKAQLAALLRDSYETAVPNALTNALLGGGGFTAAIAIAKSEAQVNGALKQAVMTLYSEQQLLNAEQASLAAKRAQATALENRLNAESMQLMAAVAQQNQLLANAPPQTVSAVGAITNLDNAAAAAALGGKSVGSGPCGNHFDFGQCTWYVATRRCVPWFGNAYQWYAAAAAYGYAEGQIPVRGAIVVFAPYGDGAGSAGHVAYVEAVGPVNGVPAGDFEVSEMNFYANGGGWDQVDFRLIAIGTPGIEGFIYGRAAG